MQLYHGDCLIEMGKIPDHSVDMILCDLPYGTTACKWDVVIPFEPLWEHYWRVLKRNGAVVLFGGQPFTAYLILSQVDKYRYNWTWNKRKAANFLFGNNQPLKKTEDICVFYSAQPTYNPQRIPCKNKGSGERKNFGSTIHEHLDHLPSSKRNGKNYDPNSLLPDNIAEGDFSIVEFSKDSRPLHPTQKPVALLEYLIKTYTNEGETILDNCMGSGSTGVACVNTNRNFIGIEKDDEYFEIAKNRIESAMPAALAS
jgi:site-specific DNA-methyltransferase (adenine-specific)